MDRKTTIKTLRDIIRKLSDKDLFIDSDFDDINNANFSCYENSRAKEYIKIKLKL